MHIAIGTPCYGGLIHARTAGALAYAVAELAIRGDRPSWLTIEGESLVPRARNMIVHRFLASDASRLVFVDADIEFLPSDIRTVLDCEEDVVGAAYPKKTPGGGLVVERLSAERIQGELVEVARIGTGFLSLSRRAIERMVTAHPEAAYRVCGGPDDGELVYALFDTSIRDGRYLSEDYVFCDRWRALGGAVWMHRHVRLGHIGSMTYREGGP